MLVALAAVLTAAAPKVALPPPPSAVDAGPRPSPYADPALSVPLVGPSSQLDIETLATLETEYALQADLSVLGRVTAANTPSILAQLAKDPRWRVSESDGAVVVVPRTGDPKAGWHTPYDGYVKSGSGAWRVAIRFGKRPPTSPWATSTVVARAKAKDPVAKIKGFQPRALPGMTAAALVWEGELCALEVFEASKDDDLSHLTNALSEIPAMLQRMVDYPTFVVLPQGEPKTGEPSATVTVSGRTVDVSARVHPPGPGVVWARVLDTNLQPWEDAAVAAGTRERIGWSEDPKQLFWMQGAFPVPAGGPVSGTLEVWFQADEGGAPTRLLASPIKVGRRS